MQKAKWIRTTYGKGYNAGWIYRTYEYRGETYQTYENVKRGNAMGEELWQQHKAEQKRIDEKLDNPKSEPKWLTPGEEAAQKAAWDEIWKMLEVEA